MARPMVSGELAKIRSDGQFSNLYLYADVPPTVYSAIVNQTFTGSKPFDEIPQVTYASGAGTLSDVKVGMTVYVGSAAGKADYGMCRIRALPTDTVFYVGENSEVAWADGAYLTVVDEFNLWPRHPNVAANILYMDYNVGYSDQHLKVNPVPIVGPRLVPVWMPVGGSIVVNFDSSLSYCVTDPSSSTVASVAWSFPGASATSGTTTHTPTATYNAVGRYRASCTLTTSQGKTETAYIYIVVFDGVNLSPLSQFDLKNATGSWDKGGWTAKITAYGEADLATIVDRAHCVIFAKDYYGGTEAELGPISNRENIVLEGWIEGESIIQNPDGGSVEFTLSTAHAWLDKMAAFGFGLFNKGAAPTDWTQWQNLTVDSFLYQVLYWQATVIPTIDVFLGGDYLNRQTPEGSVPGDMSLWQQLQYLEGNTILMRAVCDRYGRLWHQIEPDLIDPASRSSIPVVLTLLENDWRDQATMTRYIVPPTGKVSLSGSMLTAPGATPQALFGLSPGHVPKWHGKSIKQDRILLKDQASANLLTGCLLGKDNHILDFQFDLAGNNRMVDIAPNQYVGLAVSAGDTARGFTFSGNLIIKEIQLSWYSSGSHPTNFLQISWNAECETFPENYITGDTPGSTNTSLPPLPTLPPLPLPAPISPNFGVFAHCMIVTPFSGIWYTDNFDTGTPHWKKWSGNSDIDNAFAGGFMAQVDISLKSLRCYAGWDSGGDGGLYMSPGPGQPFQLILSYSDLYTRVGSTALDGMHIDGLAVNRAVDDEALVIIQSEKYTGTLYTQPSYLQRWNSGGFYGARGAIITPNQVYNRFWNHSLTPMYGQNEWLVHYIDQDASHLYFKTLVSSRDGSGISNRLTLATDGIWENQGIGMRSGGMSPAALTFGSNNPGTTPGLNWIRKTLNDGTSYSNLTSSEPSSWANCNQELANIDPTGQYLMIGAYNAVGVRYPSRSSDGGATWSPMTVGGSGEDGAGLFCGSNYLYWVYGSLDVPSHLPKIYFTPNFGLSWIDKTGDLGDYVSDVPVRLRMW